MDPRKPTRREFLNGAFAAAGAFAAGCATRPLGRPAFALDERAFIKSALVHLGQNVWCDVYTDEKPYKPNWDDKNFRADHLRTQDDMWHAYTEAMAAHGFNAVVIDLAEALYYPRHPELAVRGTWSVEKMRRELDRLRAMGLEPIPKLNFSTTHNAWMLEWRHQVGSRRYLQVVDELIQDVAETFDGPRLFHIGYDEESAKHQSHDKYQYIVVRRGEKYWSDFLTTVESVRRTGARPWCFSDQIWREHDLFVENMPRDVIQSPWNIVVDEKHPEFVKTIDEMAKLGFDIIPDGSTYNLEADGIQTSELPLALDYCGKVVPPKQFLGVIVCPWVATSRGIAHRKFMESLDFAKREFARVGR